VNSFKRFLAVTGLIGMFAIGLSGTAVAGGGGGGCAGGSSATSSGSTQVFASQISGLFADAGFSSVSGTTETDIDIFASKESFVQSSSGSRSTSQVLIVISVFDTVTGVTSVEAFGSAPTSNFQIDQALTSATLGSTSIPVCDVVTNTSSTATVAANWTGVGSKTQSVGTNFFHSGKFTTVNHFVGFSRSAQAIGSASDTALNVSFSGSAAFAGLFSLTEGFIFVCVGTTCK
jgi:hypothetical protein